jgi:hypothetical protein
MYAIMVNLEAPFMFDFKNARKSGVNGPFVIQNLKGWNMSSAFNR